MLQRSSPNGSGKRRVISEIGFFECSSESMFFPKNHFFTNKNVFYKQLSIKSIEIYSFMYHDVILSNRYYRENLKVRQMCLTTKLNFFLAFFL